MTKASLAGGLSVIVCTYNGAERIRPTLSALARCETSLPVEIVFVDNNSDDGTSHVAQKVWDEIGNQSFSFRVMQEPLQGLSYARRAGIKAAHGDVIIFCDDDNWLEPDYLTQAAQIMEDPSVGAAGGAGQPIFENGASPPPHFYNFATWLACGAQFGMAENVAEERVDLTDLHQVSLFGAALVVRRADMVTLLDLPHFPMVCDRRGDTLLSGGDYEICHLIALSGKKLIYSTHLRFKHLIPANRLNPTYLRTLAASRSHRRVIDSYIAARRLRSSGMTFRSFIKAFLKLFLAKDASLDAFQLALLLDQPWLAHPLDRPVFYNIRALKKCSVPTSSGSAGSTKTRNEF